MNNKYLIGGALVLATIYLYRIYLIEKIKKNTGVSVIERKNIGVKTFVPKNDNPINAETIKLFEAAIYNTRVGGARNIKQEEIDAKNRNDAYEKIRVLGITKEFEQWAKIKLALENPSGSMLIK